MNLKQKIGGYNKSTLRKTNAVPPKACNCRQPPYCPLDGNCLKISRDLPSHSGNGGQRANWDLCRPYWELFSATRTISLLSETQTRDSVQNSVSTSGTTLRTESPSIFLDKSGKRKRLCRHLNRLICRSSSFLDDSETSFIPDKPVLSVHARIFWSFADSFCAHAPWQDK